MKERFETFTVLIAKINRNIKKIKNQKMAEYDLRSAHVSCLYYLYVGGQLTATELCERCDEDKATVSRALDYLEKNLYITCESKSEKRYKSPISLTEKGIDIGREISEKINGVLEEISIGLDEEQRIEFYRCLAVISDGLEGIAARYDEGGSLK